MAVQAPKGSNRGAVSPSPGALIVTFIPALQVLQPEGLLVEISRSWICNNWQKRKKKVALDTQNIGKSTQNTLTPSSMRHRTQEGNIHIPKSGEYAFGRQIKPPCLQQSDCSLQYPHSSTAFQIRSCSGVDSKVCGLVSTYHGCRMTGYTIFLMHLWW